MVLLALGLGGIIQLYRGLRGRPVFTTPHCRQCKYDLRAANYMEGTPRVCPECGLDLTRENAVLFGEYRRRPKLIIVGLVLLFLIIPAYFGAVFALSPIGQSTAATAPRMSTPGLLARLPQTADEPWDWQELERRRSAGKLTPADVDTAFAALAQNINQKSAGSRSNPLPWSRDFVVAAMKAKLASPAQVQKLAEAFFADVPTIRIRPIFREGQDVECDISSDAAWDLAGYKGVFHLKKVLWGDTEIPIQYQGRNETDPDMLSGRWGGGSVDIRLKKQLPRGRGDQELKFIFDVGAVDERDSSRGKENRPGPRAKWGTPLAVWEKTVTKKVHIVGQGEPLVTLIQDSARDPFPGNGLKISQFYARPTNQGVELVIEWQPTGQAATPVAGKIMLQLGKDKIEYGKVAFHGSGRTSWGAQPLKALAPEIRSATITIVPDEEFANTSIGATEIWGKPIEFDDVPLERLDLTDK